MFQQCHPVADCKITPFSLADSNLTRTETYSLFFGKIIIFFFLVQPLDFEARDEYNLKLAVENVKALSSKAPNLPLSTATVQVKVVNENEAPHFREDPILIVVPESVLPGTSLKSNYAFDPENSKLR